MRSTACVLISRVVTDTNVSQKKKNPWPLIFLIYTHYMHPQAVAKLENAAGLRTKTCSVGEVSTLYAIDSQLAEHMVVNTSICNVCELDV